MPASPHWADDIPGWLGDVAVDSPGPPSDIAGDVALAFVNHGTNATEVVCDSDCFAAIGLSDAKSLAVRDMWAHADLPTRRPPYSFTVNVTGDGSTEAFRLSRVM